MSLAIRNPNIENEKLFEKVILQNDLAGLSPLEKVEHVRNMCLSLGLNPLTKPIQLHKFDGKEICYMSKDGTEQLRNLHEVSIIKLETEIVNDTLYIVKAYAQKPNGRVDCSTSVQTISGLKGKAIENAMKKCETQAKRRVTLSICGLGMLDESEIQDVPARISKPVNLQISSPPKLEEINDDDMDFNADIERISKCETIDQLKDIFNTLTAYWRDKKDLLKVSKIVELKDKRKSEIEAMLFNEEIENAIQ